MRNVFIAVGIAVSGFVFGASTLIIASQAQDAPDPYRVSGGSTVYHSVRIVPWTDPETGCRYLITQSTHGDIATSLRADRFGNKGCMQTDAR